MIGADSLVRVDAPTMDHPIKLDDWTRASRELPIAADAALTDYGAKVAGIFLSEVADPYAPAIS